ncbi:MAG TPA: transposase [Thermomicrobiales bacterium]|nr:transposase [Thermomicrobiales bacterium]
MPGVVFHLTARIQCRAPLLADIEGSAASMILEATARSDARLVAYAVMPNHLHIVLQQGGRPLSHYMQPLLRRIALLVRRTRAWEGHVFERRYRESACLTAEYLRNAIAYVHLNGLRAALASSVDTYEWCSQRRFCDCDAPDHLSRMAMEDALRVFAPFGGDVLARCRDNYREFVSWRIAMDAHAAQADANAGGDFHPPSPPSLFGGDEHWTRAYEPFVQAEAESRKRAPRRMDLRDIARTVMADVDPAMRLEDLREGGSTRTLIRVRNAVIVRAAASGYSSRAIARFLSVSPPTVSSIRCRR